jgi:hypothetical protein
MDRRSNRRLAAAILDGLTCLALVLLGTGNTGDTPCGSILRANFSWSIGGCSYGYRFRLALVCTLLVSLVPFGFARQPNRSWYALFPIVVAGQALIWMIVRDRSRTLKYFPHVFSSGIAATALALFVICLVATVRRRSDR